MTGLLLDYGITAAQYISTIKPVIARVRAKFPESTIAVVAAKVPNTCLHAYLVRVTGYF
jgi:broad specificity phosphatase PhoE